MSLVVPQAGLEIQVEVYRTEWNANLVRLHLYKNDYTPVIGSALGNFTEADFSGYSSQQIAAWSAHTWTSPRAIIQASAALTFSNSTGAVGNDVYGYYVTDSGGNLLWAERDPSAPVDMGSAGRTYIITARYSVRSEF